MENSRVEAGRNQRRVARDSRPFSKVGDGPGPCLRPRWGERTLIVDILSLHWPYVKWVLSGLGSGQVALTLLKKLIEKGSAYHGLQASAE